MLQDKSKIATEMGGTIPVCCYGVDAQRPRPFRWTPPGRSQTQSCHIKLGQDRGVLIATAEQSEIKLIAGPPQILRPCH